MEQFRFNSDVLSDDESLRWAQDEFPNLSRILQHDDLRLTFQAEDKQANAAKRRSRRTGICAVLLGVFALWAAALEPLLETHENVRAAVAAVSAVLGVMSVFIGFAGVLYRGKKERWLRRRWCTERLRQLHFQTMLADVVVMLQAAALKSNSHNYFRWRSELLDDERRIGFLHLANEQTKLKPWKAEHRKWLVEQRSGAIDGNDVMWLEFLRAYESLRFEHQIAYAKQALGEEEPFRKLTPATLLRLLTWVSMSCIIIVLLVHVFIILGILMGSQAFHLPAINVLTIWIAVVALGARTLEEGLQPGREVERLEGYISTVHRLRERFQAARTPEAKLDSMRQMEEAAYDEMMIFFRASDEAKFAM